MPGTDLSNSEDLGLLEEAAREAGALALGYFGKEPETWFKDNKSPVSEADMAVDRFLGQKLLAARDSYGWLSEETADDKSRLDAQRVFVVDPIDGTRAFLAGGEEWTISIAVVENGRPVAGVVYCPVREEMFLAETGRGAKLNASQLKVAGTAEVAGANLTGPHSIVANKDVLAAGFVRSENIRSLAYRIALVAAARVDAAAARANAHDWDLAAADLLVQEAGGRLTDLDGAAIRYNRDNTRHPALLAAPASLHDPARLVIARAIG